MGTEQALCVVCAWRKDCLKKFTRSQDSSSRCPDYTKDISIKNGAEPDDKKEDTGNNR